MRAAVFAPKLIGTTALHGGRRRRPTEERVLGGSRAEERVRREGSRKVVTRKWNNMVVTRKLNDKMVVRFLHMQI